MDLRFYIKGEGGWHYRTGWTKPVWDDLTAILLRWHNVNDCALWISDWAFLHLQVVMGRSILAPPHACSGTPEVIWFSWLSSLWYLQLKNSSALCVWSLVSLPLPPVHLKDLASSKHQTANQEGWWGLVRQHSEGFLAGGGMLWKHSSFMSFQNGSAWEPTYKLSWLPFQICPRWERLHT